MAKVINFAVILSFMAVAYLYHLNRTAGNFSHLFLSSDAENIASFAAASENPKFFSNDELLSNKKNFAFYSTIHIPATRIISKFTGDFGSGFAALCGLHIFIQLLGFYLLGWIIFQNKYWAVVLAIATLMHIPLTMGEFWGMYYDPLPRISFQALLPYLLAAVFYWRSKPFAWPYLLGFCGIMMYIHPASVPAWGLAIWLGLWVFQPSDWSLSKRIIIMLGLAFVFFIAALPVLINYLSNHIQGQVKDYALIFEIMKYRSHKGYFNIPLAFRQFILNITFMRVCLIGIAGFVYIWFYQKPERKKAMVILLWMLGILFTSAFIPFVEQLFVRANKTIPVETQLIRGLRYLFPLMLIFCIWLPAGYARNLLNRKNKITVILIASFLIFIWCARQTYKHVVFLKENGRLIFQVSKNKTAEIMDMLSALKRLTPQGARILSIASFPELSIRYYALRPLAYASKDGGPFYYSNHAELIKWYEKTKELENLEQTVNSGVLNNVELPVAFLKFSREFKADFLLIDRGKIPDSDLFSFSGVVYYNSLYILIKTSA